jgi:hypothetical protein
MRGSNRLFDIIQRLRTASKPTAARRNSRLISKERHAPSIVTSQRSRAAGPYLRTLHCIEQADQSASAQRAELGVGRIGRQRIAHDPSVAV